MQSGVLNDPFNLGKYAVYCFDNGYEGKIPVAWEKYWLKDIKESMDICTDHPDITEILLKTAINTIRHHILGRRESKV